MNKPDHGIRRKREPRQLADVLHQLMRRRGYSRLLSQDEYGEVWQQIAGPLAQVSRPGQLRRGVLEVVANSSSVLQELTFQKRHLLRELSGRMPEQKISDLRFVVGVID